MTGAHHRTTLLRAGVAAHELSGPLWTPVHRGVYRWEDGGGPSPRTRALAAAHAVTAHALVTGWAAAALLGCGDLDGSSADGAPVDVEVALDRDRRIRRAGIRPVRSGWTDEDVVEVDGVRVATAVRAAFDAARLAPSFTEAVVALDACLRDLKDLDRGDLLSYVDERRSWRGAARVRRALEIADPRAASPGESRLRVLWLLGAQLPAPEVRPLVLVADTGRVIAEPDLLDVSGGLVAEYDGSHHADAPRRSEDSRRREDMEVHDLRVVQVTKHDLRRERRNTTVARLHAARAEAMSALGGRPARWAFSARSA